MTLTIFLLFVIQSPCARYGTQPVVLTGIIKAHAFPGRPSYESIARGDEPERTWLIHLDKPICIETDMFSPKENVSKLQLVFEEGRRQYEIYRPMLGQRVVVEASCSTQIPDTITQEY